jgi:creatinine amidohydrolase
MKWEHTRAGDFDKVLEQCGYTCIVPIGSLEPHGHHMPVGTDYFTAKAFAEQAAEIEPCMVFPAMYLGAVYESAAMKGAVNLRPDLLIQLYFNIFDEIARNGFKKIIIYSAHGGNTDFVSLLTYSALYERKPYTLYRVKSLNLIYSVDMEEIREDFEGRPWGHGCEWEASLMMHLTDDVDLSVVPDEVFQRPKAPEGLDLRRISTGIEWYAQTPMYYVGNPSKATAERGKRYTEIAVKNLAAIIKNVKENTSTHERTMAYYDEIGR